MELWDVHFYNDEGHSLGSVMRVSAQSQDEAIKSASQQKPELKEKAESIFAVHSRERVPVF